MYNVRNCVDTYKAVTKTDVNDPLALTGGRVTNFFNSWNSDVIFLYRIHT
jgi:hypothetical protein